MGNGGLGAEKGAFHIDIDDAVPILFAAIFEGGVLEKSGVVDQDIELAEVGDGAIDAGAHRGFVGHVQSQATGAGTDFFGGCAGGSGVDIGQRHPCAFEGEEFGDGPADAAASSGN